MTLKHNTASTGGRQARRTKCQDCALALTAAAAYVREIHALFLLSYCSASTWLVERCQMRQATAQRNRNLLRQFQRSIHVRRLAVQFPAWAARA